MVYVEYCVTLSLTDLDCVVCCCRYFISFLLDSSVGLLIIILCLKILRLIFKKKGYNSLLFGQYGVYYSHVDI